MQRFFQSFFGRDSQWPRISTSGIVILRSVSFQFSEKKFKKAASPFSLAAGGFY
jgi:hypothetical protein